MGCQIGVDTGVYYILVRLGTCPDHVYNLNMRKSGLDMFLLCVHMNSSAHVRRFLTRMAESFILFSPWLLYSMTNTLSIQLHGSTLSKVGTRAVVVFLFLLDSPED